MHAFAAIVAICVLWVLPGAVRGQAAAPSASPASAQLPTLEPGVLTAVRTQSAELALRALEAAQPGEDAPHHYLRARLLQRAGRYREAVQTLGAALSGPGGLPAAVVAEARLRQVRLLARLGDFRRALALSESLPQDAQTLALRGEACLGLGEHPRALPLLQRALDNPGTQDPAALLLGLSDAQRALGRQDEAQTSLRRLLLEQPLSPLVTTATERLKALGGELSPTAAERLDRAQRLLKGFAPGRALEGLEAPFGRLAAGERARLLHLRGMSMFKMRTRYAEAARVLARAAKLGGPSAISDGFHAARALSRADRDRAAVRAYRRFIKRHPGHRLAHRAHYLAGWLSVRHGFAGGVRALQTFIDGPGARAMPALSRSATFHLAMHAFDRHRYTAARTGFDRYQRIASSAMDRARGQYWAGRSAQLARNVAAAVQHYRGAQAIDPLHYYALQAQGRLAQLGQPASAPFEPVPPAPSPPAIGDTTELSRQVRWPLEVRFYAALGLDRDAARVLRAQRKTLQADPAIGARGLAGAYVALRAYGRSFRTVSRHASEALRRAPQGDDLWAWQASYPRPYAAEVERLAAAEGLSTEHVYAIMRKESAFDPTVASSADALGLLQLLPKTGMRLAAELGMPFNREALFDPTTNLRLGIRHIGELWRRLDGHPVLAIAAFNAGAHRVHAWQQHATARAKGKPIEVDRFVESIPIDQTRNYVRRVLTYWAHYRYLREPAAGFPPPPPEHVPARTAR